MITLSEAYSIIQDINENAHSRAWDIWVQADELMESDDEADWDIAEEIRDQASQNQAEYFREEFDSLDEETKDAILNYVETDESFKDEFITYYGENDFENNFN